MKYMMLVCVDGASFEATTAEEDRTGPDPQDDGSFPWLDEVTERGVRLDGDRLRPPSNATTVRVRDGQTLLSDGPFVETKEVICGYDILDCKDLDEALEIAAKHPCAAIGAIEVRPFWK
jgi:hypothetical protein